MGKLALRLSAILCLLFVSPLHAQERNAATTSISPAFYAPIPLELGLRKPRPPEETLAAIKPDMTSLEVRSVLEEHQPDSGWSATSYSKLTAFERYRLGDEGIHLLVRYDDVKDPNGNIENDDRVGAAKLVRFEELRSEIGDELFPLVRLIHFSPSPRGRGFDSAALIRAVNALRAAGKDKALRALRRYDAIAWGPLETDEEIKTNMERRFEYDFDEQRIFLIARLLFVRSDGDERMPWMVIGATSPDVKDDQEGGHFFAPKDWPLFPLVLQDGIPFCMSGGYVLAGEAEPPRAHLDYCEKNCKLRERDLSPSVAPLAAAQRVFESASWKRLFKSREKDSRTRYLLRAQALASAAWAHGEVVAKDDMNPNLMPDDQTDRTWAAWTQMQRLQQVRWDERSQRFVPN